MWILVAVVGAILVLNLAVLSVGVRRAWVRRYRADSRATGAPGRRRGADRAADAWSDREAM